MEEKLASEVGIRTNILDWVHLEKDWPDICGLDVVARIGNVYIVQWSKSKESRKLSYLIIKPSDWLCHWKMFMMLVKSLRSMR